MNYNASTKSYVAVNSIDLLEECLDTINRARRMSLNARSERAQALLDRRRSKLASQSKAIASRMSHDRLDIKAIRERQQQEAEQLQQQEYREDEDDEQQSINPSNISKMNNANNNNNSSNNNTTHHNNSSNNANPSPAINDNQRAQCIYDEFEAEIRNWWLKADEKREDEEAKGEYADYLTEKYMCQKLDSLPSSKEITAIRKKMYKTIEDLATDPKFTVHIPSDDDQESADAHISSNKVHSLTHKAHHSHSQKTATATTSGSSSSSSSSSSKIGVVGNGNTAISKVLTPAERAIERANAQAATKQQQSVAAAAAAAAALSTPQLTAKEQKQLEEKTKIQEQYQEYMKMKQKTAEADRQAQLEQYESLNEDIKGLLSSIQHGKGDK